MRINQAVNVSNIQFSSIFVSRVLSDDTTRNKSQKRESRKGEISNENGFC
ncbi:hypothetical protein PANT111_190157 [Pantoea brenneri]|uniref:Uncharacterized protein n=1 Tax=Pantoea brenneri TaxID=472694 RepID=A0AAX3J6B4_9GAMM|nr:hypothetical protein PANT111_190157 [Pantoea brenneri]